MPPIPIPKAIARDRTLYCLTHPQVWEHWPILPLVRRRPGCEEEMGVVFDALGACGLTGLSATVWMENMFLLPPKLDDFLALPHETFDTPEEVINAGWVVD